MFVLAFIDTLQKGFEATNTIADSWNEVWKLVLGIDSGAVAGKILFSLLCSLGELFAVGTLIFFALEFFKDLNEGNWGTLTNLLWALVVVVLLSNNGKMLATLSYQVRNYINTVNQKVLQYAVDGADLQETFQMLQRSVGDRMLISNYFQHCENLVGDDQLICFKETAARLKAEIQPQEPSTSGGFTSYLDKLLDVLGALGSSALKSNPFDPFYTGSNELGIKLGSLFSPLWESAAFNVLNAFMQGYQQFLEISLLLTVLAGPLAVGGTLLPWGVKPIFAWLTGFFTVGFAKLSFNLIAGLTAVAAVNADAMMDQLPLYLIFGFFAPMLSAGLSSLGGLAVWNALTGAAESAAGFFGKGLDMIF